MLRAAPAVPRVLLLAYHFPPVGGAGVQRSVKFTRYLPESGWEPVVVTGPIGSVGDSFLTDETFHDELPAELELHRVVGPEPLPGTGWRGRAERWVRLPPVWASWWVDGAVAASSGVRDVDVVFATMSPFASADAAARIAARLSVPWVADLRDPWALDEMRVYPTAVHRRLEERRMRRSLASAAGIVMNTAEAAEVLIRRFPELRSKRVVAIPNGYDAADFAADPPARADRSFAIVHTGDLHTGFGLRHRRRRQLQRFVGGAVEGVDILTRSHVFLLKAIEDVRRRRRDLRDVLELHLVGALDSSDRDAIESDAVHLHGYVNHAEAVKLMRTADLLFLPMHDLPPGRRATIVPGKTYEYLAARRPVLAAIPDGDARDLLERAGSAVLTRPDDTAAMAAAIEEAADRKARGTPPPAPDEDLLAAYERRALTKRLAELLDQVAAKT